MGAKRVIRRKAVRKEENINVRLTAEQKAELTAAATHVGLGVSTWLLTIGLREARKPSEDGTVAKVATVGRR